LSHSSTPHNTIWIFDLDDTLHHASRGVFASINQHMTAFIAAELALDWAAADALRQHYWRTYAAPRHLQTAFSAGDPPP
jgi:putative hydrolase of the HAD superfamily